MVIAAVLHRMAQALAPPLTITNKNIVETILVGEKLMVEIYFVICFLFSV
jgi:hypothetical protein